MSKNKKRFWFFSAISIRIFLEIIFLTAGMSLAHTHTVIALILVIAVLILFVVGQFLTIFWKKKLNE